MRSMLGMSVRAGLVGCAAASGAWAQATRDYADVGYGNGDPAQVLDLYLPEGEGPFPVVVWVHGGGWQGGDKSGVNFKAGLLNERGIAVASINYRLSDVATHPAQIHDCKAAVRFLRSTAQQYQLDPRRIGVWGGSAGGHLSALLGTSWGSRFVEGEVGSNLFFSSRVQAAADYFGPTDFLAITDPAHTACDSPESNMLGVCLGDVIEHQGEPGWGDDVALVRSAGGAEHVNPLDPAFYIAHGTEDPVVDPAQSQILYDALVDAGVAATLNYVNGAGHGVPGSVDVEVADFFAQRIGAGFCGPDVNGDGALDPFDYDDFVSAFFSGNPNADYNLDTRVDAFDYDDFVSEYFSGC